MREMRERRERDEREMRERERENFPGKSCNLKSSLARSQNKVLTKYQRRASPLWTGPSPTGGREAAGQQPEPKGKGAITAPEMAFSTKL